MGGAVSKAVLPYGETTSTLEQAHHANKPEMEVLVSAGLSEQQVGALVRDALALRKLIRVKLADDNDLDQAELAVGELGVFFGALQTYADAQGCGEYAVLQQL